MELGRDQLFWVGVSVSPCQMTCCSHPSKTSCHSQTELTKQSRAVPPTHCTDLPKGNIRGQKNSDVWGQGIYQKIVKRCAKNAFFPLWVQNKFICVTNTAFLFFYSAVIGGFFRKSFSAVHQELAWEQEFVPIPCNQCWLVMPAACERKSAFSGHGNSSDSMRAGGVWRKTGPTWQSSQELPPQRTPGGGLSMQSLCWVGGNKTLSPAPCESPAYTGGRTASGRIIGMNTTAVHCEAVGEHIRNLTWH